MNKIIRLTHPKHGDLFNMLITEPKDVDESRPPGPGHRVELWRAQTFYTKEPETIEWINGFDDRGVFWDIGANIGIYTLYTAHRHPNMRIEAFEPMKENFVRLWQNVLINDFVNVTAHFKAFGEIDKDARFDPGRTDIGSSGGQAGATGYPIKMICGDFNTKHYGDPSYIKIDTDGNEYDILFGMSWILRSKKLKSVLVEVNNHDEQVANIMTDAGFVVDDELMALKNRPEHDHNVIFTRK